MKLLILCTTFFILLLDQIFKIYIKTHFKLYTGFNIISNLLSLYFIENPGIACVNVYLNNFDLFTKLLLTVFRLFFVFYILFFFLKTKIKNKYFLFFLSILFYGSFSNLLDNLFYGVFFDKNSFYDYFLHKWVPYTGISKLVFCKKNFFNFMLGNVVDMICLNFKYFFLKDFFNFSIIFNIADLSIFISIVFLMIYYIKYLF